MYRLHSCGPGRLPENCQYRGQATGKGQWLFADCPYIYRQTTERIWHLGGHGGDDAQNTTGR
jgi:hypothetical protein